MKPIITKTETLELNGQELTLLGEVFDAPKKEWSSSEYDIHSRIHIQNNKGDHVHPGFSYPKQLSEDELQFELDFHKKNIVEKPKAYGL